jgi:hypothetical protein
MKHLRDNAGSKEVSYFKALETTIREGILIFVLPGHCIPATLETKMANPSLGSSNYGETTTAAMMEKLIMWVCTNIVVSNNSLPGMGATAALQSMRAFFKFCLFLHGVVLAYYVNKYKTILYYLESSFTY